MANSPKTIIEDVLKARGGKVSHVYFVACGGSYAGLYPAKFFLQSEVKNLVIGHYTANEFCHATPKALGKDSIVITQSFSGNTPETVRAAKIAQEAGAASITVTYDAESPLAKNGDYVVTYGQGGGAAESGTAKSLSLAAEILNQVEGYEHYDKFINSFDKVGEIAKKAKEAVADKAKDFAKKYADEPLIYMMGSGANWGITYSFAICLLQEMQWIQSSAIHSGEYFHGPFEITDKETPFIMLMSTGRTRALDQRALDFLNRFAEKVIVIDNEELGLKELDPAIAEYFNIFVTSDVLDVYYTELSIERKHPRTVRRYMWKLQY